MRLKSYGFISVPGWNNGSARCWRPSPDSTDRLNHNLLLLSVGALIQSGSKNPLVVGMVPWLLPPSLLRDPSWSWQNTIFLVIRTLFANRTCRVLNLIGLFLLDFRVTNSALAYLYYDAKSVLVKSLQRHTILLNETSRLGQ